MHTSFLNPMHKLRTRSTKERVSINNFVATINDQVVGILNERMFEKGIVRIGPIGGGARLHNKTILNQFNAQDIDRQDARFTIEKQQRAVILETFLKPNAQIVETDIRRELFEELCNVVYDPSEEGLYPLLKASRNMSPIITPETLEEGLLYTSFLDTLAHRWPSQHHAPLMTNYFWYLHEVYVTQKVFSELIKSGGVIIMTPELIEKGHMQLQPILPSLQAIYERVESNKQRL